MYLTSTENGNNTIIRKPHIWTSIVRFLIELLIIGTPYLTKQKETFKIEFGHKLPTG